MLTFKKPYNDKGACNWPRSKYRLAKGVYIIKVGEEIKYVGRSNYCLYRAAYRHFANWCKGKRIGGKYGDTYYDRNGDTYLSMFLTDNPEMTEVELTHKLKPTDNRNRFGETSQKMKKPVFAYEEDYKIIDEYQTLYDANT